MAIATFLKLLEQCSNMAHGKRIGEEEEDELDKAINKLRKHYDQFPPRKIECED